MKIEITIQPHEDGGYFGRIDSDAFATAGDRADDTSGAIRAAVGLALEVLALLVKEGSVDAPWTVVFAYEVPV